MNAPITLPDDAPDAAKAIAASYAQLRARYTELRSAPVPDMRAIDEVVDRLAQMQLAFKASHGLTGNNPADE